MMLASLPCTEKDGWHNRRQILVLQYLLVIGLAAVLRWWAIGEKSYWLDETYTLARVRASSWEQLLRDIQKNDAHPPFYYLCLYLWIKIGGTSETWCRSYSALVGLGTVILSLAWGYLWGNARLALWLGLLSACAPFLIYYSQETRAYSLAIFWALASHYCLARALYKQERLCWWLYWLTGVLGLYTFYYFLFVLAAQLVVLIGLLLAREFTTSSFWGLLKVQVLIGVAFLPWAVMVIPAKLHLLQQYMPANTVGLPSLVALEQALVSIVWGLHSKSGLLNLWTLATLLLWGVAAIMGWRHNRRATVWVVIGAFIPMLCVLGFPLKGHVFQAKHLALSIPMLYFLLAYLQGYWRPLVLGLVLLVNGIGLTQYYAPSYQKEAWQEAVAYITTHSQRGDGICFNPFYLQVPFTYYYLRSPHPVPLVLHLSYDSRGGSLDPAPVDPRYLWLSRSDIQRAADQRLWLVQVRNSPVAPPDPRLVQWCREVFQYENTKILPGQCGQIVIRFYHQRRP